MDRRSVLLQSGGTGSRLFSSDSPRDSRSREYTYLPGDHDLRSPMRSDSTPRTPSGDGYGGYGGYDATPMSRASRPSAVGSARRGMGGMGGMGGGMGSGMRGRPMSGLRARATLSARTSTMSDAPPTASYDDDDDDEAASLLVAAGAGDRYGASPDKRAYSASRGALSAGTPGGYGMDRHTLALHGRGMVGGTMMGMGMDDDGLGMDDGFGAHDTAAAAAGLTREDDGLYRNNRWVTVFGFRPGLSGTVLRYFQAYGTVVSQRVSNSNWLHLQYETVDQANSALGANGRVHDGFMLGVVRCTDMTALSSDGHADTGVGHHKLGRASMADTHLDSEPIFKPRRRRKNICSRMCDWLCKSW